MAFTFDLRLLGPGQYQVVIEETGVGAADEAVVPGIPVRGSVIRQVCLIQGGAATTVEPCAGLAPDPTGTGRNELIVQVDAPAAEVDIQGTASYPIGGVPSGATSTLYHRSNVDAGPSDVTTTYLIVADWP